MASQVVFSDSDGSGSSVSSRIPALPFARRLLLQQA
jgi:hypothetical protein